jgi:hypothetical protein
MSDVKYFNGFLRERFVFILTGTLSAPIKLIYGHPLSASLAKLVPGGPLMSQLSPTFSEFILSDHTVYRKYVRLEKTY